jgi:bifunctional non-homologous end joining protein LigD
VANQVLEPIMPMEPRSAQDIPEGNDWIAQVKWDGVRVLTYADGTEVKLFNRHGRERTFHYPELLNIASYCKAHSIVLDGEVIALGPDGRPNFHQVMKRDGIRRMDRVNAARKQVPVTYMVFDVLYYDGEWITNQPFSKRTDVLSRIIEPTPYIQVVESQTDGMTLFDVMKQYDMEGVVMKKLDSRYIVGEKTSQWLKVKNYRDLIAVIGGYTLNDAGVVNAVLLGLYDNAGQLHYIGHTGTGKLSHQEWRQLTQVLKAVPKAARPFVNKPDRGAEALWVEPTITVKIQFAEWTAGHSLRQPSIQGIVDVEPGRCMIEAEMRRN